MLSGLALAPATALASLLAAPVATAHDPECDIMMPVGNQLETIFDQVEPQGFTPPGLGDQIIEAQRPLQELSGQTAIDLRNWSDILADKLNHGGRYAQAGTDELWLAADLGAARSHLHWARQYCAWWSDYWG